MTALRFVVSTVLDLYILTYILRFVSQWVRSDPRNPFWQFVVQITNPLVRPLRQVVPAQLVQAMEELGWQVRTSRPAPARRGAPRAAVVVAAVAGPA